MKIEYIAFLELLCEIIDNRGRTCPTSESGIPLIATNCIHNDSLYPTFENIRYISKETYETWFRGHPEPGDIIFVNKGTPGRVCLVPYPVNFCIAQDMVAIRADSKKIYPKYLFAILRSPEIQTQIENMHVGTLIPHFKKGDFNKLLIPVPDRNSQKIVGDFYFLLSYKIELNRQMNETLEVMARAIFQSWFVDFDPVRTKADGRQLAGMDAETADLFPDGFEEVDGREVPKGWKIHTLGELVHFVKGKKPEKVFDIQASGYEQQILIDTFKGKNPGFAKTEDNVVSLENDVLMVMDGASSGRVELGYKGVIGSTIAKIETINRMITPEILYYYLKTKESEIQDNTTGTSIPHADRKRIDKLEIAIPNNDLFNKYSHLAGFILNLINNNKREIQTLAQIRDTLLPKLMKGEVNFSQVNDITQETT